tara:strand:- start:3047 stop:3259 length:213 start_codon:yes stop_codon:yes gene_type:complete
MATTNAKPAVVVTPEFCERVDFSYRLGGRCLAEGAIRGEVFRQTGYFMSDEDAQYLASVVEECLSPARSR